MADQAPVGGTATGFSQLSQVRVPLDEAADAFATKDASGRTPIVVLTARSMRVRTLFLIVAGIAVAAALFGDRFTALERLVPIAVVVAIIALVVGVVQSLYVRVPEGTNAIMTKAGKYDRTIGPGAHVIMPNVAVSHLVTRREIPFEVPVVDAPTSDSVRAAVDVLVTFTITEPNKFVYSISASDFDQVFQAACQYAMRAMIREITSEEINDLVRHDTSGLKAKVSEDVAPYGVTLQKMTITFARPPADFQASQEARQLAVFQLDQQVEEQALAQRRQASLETLARQQIVAQVDRQREELQAQAQTAEMRRQVTELEMQAQELRLGRLEELLSKYPNAAKWEWESAQLEVARALAGNTRAFLQVGTASDIVRTLMVRQLTSEPAAQAPADKPSGQLEDKSNGQMIDLAAEQ